MENPEARSQARTAVFGTTNGDEKQGLPRMTATDGRTPHSTPWFAQLAEGMKELGETEQTAEWWAQINNEPGSVYLDPVLGDDFCKMDLEVLRARSYAKAIPPPGWRPCTAHGEDTPSETEGIGEHHACDICGDVFSSFKKQAPALHACT